MRDPGKTIATIPASGEGGSPSFVATEHWTGGLHWTHFVPTHQPHQTKTLVLVHGASHNEMVWTLGPNPWVGIFTSLGYRVITVSLGGHRPSLGNVTFKTLASYVKDAYTPVAQLDLADQDLIYIGHSMGGVVIQLLFAKRPQIAGCVVVDCVAVHRCLGAYMRSTRTLLRQHPGTFLASFVNPAALFATPAMIREFLLGEDADDALVGALHKQLGGETSIAMPTMLMAQLKGMQKLDGSKMLFLSASRSAFFPPSITLASAQELGARCHAIESPHNLMMTPHASEAAQRVVEFLETRAKAGTDA